MSPTEKTPQLSSSGETITDRRELLEALHVAQGKLIAVDDRAFMSAQGARKRRARHDYLTRALSNGLLAGDAKDCAEQLLLVHAMRAARDD